MSDKREFIPKSGVCVESFDGLFQNYVTNGENITASISAENQKKLFSELLSVMPEPVFFFIEIPLTEEEEKKQENKNAFHYNLYYLDNCTSEVAKAVIKRYGDILFADGLCRFGFGSHNEGDEIYMQSYQVLSLYSPDKKRLSAFENVLDGIGAKKQDKLDSLWDFISSDNPGKLVSVEVNGETVYDIYENLTSEGMYFASVVE